MQADINLCNVNIAIDLENNSNSVSVTTTETVNANSTIGEILTNVKKVIEEIKVILDGNNSNKGRLVWIEEKFLKD